MADKVLVLANSCISTMVYTYPVPEAHIQIDSNFSANLTVGCMGPGKAFNLKKLGFDTFLHTVLGSDQPGRRIMEKLDYEGIRLIYDIDPAGTNTHVNIMTVDGRRSSVNIITPTLSPEIDLSRLEPIIAESDYIALNVNNYCRHVIPMIKKYHRNIWCDLGDFEVGNPYFDDFAEAATHITMSGIYINDQEAVLEQFMKKGKTLVVITNGAEGSVAVTDSGEHITTPAIKDYQLVDSNGAGDSFFSGLLYGYSKGFPIRKSLEIATIIAGLTVSSIELFNRDLCEDLVSAEYERVYFHGGTSNKVNAAYARQAHDAD